MLLGLGMILLFTFCTKAVLCTSETRINGRCQLKKNKNIKSNSSRLNPEEQCAYWALHTHKKNPE